MDELSSIAEINGTSRPGEESWPVSIKEAIRQYLETGNDDTLFLDWPGQNYMEKAKNHRTALHKALVCEVRRRAADAAQPAIPAGIDLVAFTRARVLPMVDGLFPADERAVVLGILERSVIFLDSDNIEKVLAAEHFSSSAWRVANFYLGTLGCLGLDDKRCQILGMSEETTCLVSPAYFTEEDRFSDFIVHETAHIFHNWKREYAGLPYSRTREWLLSIDFNKRETFAYACEAYSRILTLGRTRAERKSLLDEYAARVAIGDERADAVEVVDILREAIAARNGWKRILARCAPMR